MDYLFRIALIGDSNVGKTALLKRFVVSKVYAVKFVVAVCKF